MKTIIILQGISGSGKSTWASKQKEAFALLGCEIVSADDFFLRNGKYEFSPARLGEAHSACFRKFVHLIHDPHVQVIIVDNTNVSQAQISPYIQYAQAFLERVNFRIVRFNVLVLDAWKRNIHQVKEDVLNLQSSNLALSGENWPKNWPMWEDVFCGLESAAH